MAEDWKARRQVPVEVMETEARGEGRRVVWIREPSWLCTLR